MDSLVLGITWLLMQSVNIIYLIISFVDRLLYNVRRYKEGKYFLYLYSLIKDFIICCVINHQKHLLYIQAYNLKTELSPKM